jgi:RNA polymerase sigma factor (sigma-70 family)
MPFPWEAFLTRYGPMARALARPLVRPPASADDVVQDAALALHHALRAEPERFGGDLGPARNYFLRAARNLALKSARGGGREQGLEREPADRNSADPAGAELLRAIEARQRALARLLVALEPEARDLIRRRYLEQHTLARVSRETGVPLSTLHDRERALLARLRRELERELPGDEAAGNDSTREVGP